MRNLFKAIFHFPELKAPPDVLLLDMSEDNWS